MSSTFKFLKKKQLLVKFCFFLSDLIFSLLSVSFFFSFFSKKIWPCGRVELCQYWCSYNVLNFQICRSKGYLCQNRSIWFPYRKEVYLIANTLSSHMEQFDLGVSVWGFALLSRPLILGVSFLKHFLVVSVFDLAIDSTLYK